VSFDDLPLARAAADRAAHLRTDPDVLARALADPHTRVLLVGDGSVVTVDPGERAGGSPDVVGGAPTGARADVGAPNLDGWGRRRGAAAPTAIAYLDPRAAAAVGRTLGSTPDGNGQGNGNGNGQREGNGQGNRNGQGQGNGQGNGNGQGQGNGQGNGNGRQPAQQPGAPGR